MKAILRTKENVLQAIEFLKSLDLKLPFEISVTRLRKKRTLPQNKLLWKWLSCISDETGEDKDVLYQYFCQKHLPWRADCCFGEEVNLTGGTSGMSTVEFTEFLDKINQQMIGYGILLPHPGDLGWDDFVQKYS